MSKREINKIVVLTGAGISAESGIATFRAEDGMWVNNRIEDVATPEAFIRNPALVHAFYNERRAEHEGSTQDSTGLLPNAAHLALADFEKSFSGSFLLITQNVDALHERAGSVNLLHMHGELLKMRCDDTDEIFEWRRPSSVEDRCDCCAKPGKLRPHIVWFGEVPFHMPLIERALFECDLFVSIGTSGNVYPAAGFSRLASSNGARTVELNLERAQNASTFDESEYGLGTEIVPRYFSKLLCRS